MTPGMGFRYFNAPAINSSAAPAFAASVQKMTTCENMIKSAMALAAVAFFCELWVSAATLQAQLMLHFVFFTLSSSLCLPHFVSFFLSERPRRQSEKDKGTSWRFLS